LKEVR